MDTVIIEDALLIHSTNMAYLIEYDDEEIWIPKSQVINMEFGKNIDHNGRPAKEIISMEIPEWLAEDKNLI